MKLIPILLIEDDENDALFLEHAFQAAEIKNPLHRVADGQAAIDYLSGAGQYADRSRYPLACLVILDLQMPRRSGFEVLEWLRARPDLKRLPVIIHSGSAQQRDVDRAYELGANAFVSKPSSMAQRVEFARHIKGFWLHFNEPPSTCAAKESAV